MSPMCSITTAHTPRYPPQRPPPPLNPALSDKNKANDFSISEAGSPRCKQFSLRQASQKKRARWDGIRKRRNLTDLVFSSRLENNDTPGEDFATQKPSLFTAELICRAPSLPLMLNPNSSVSQSVRRAATTTRSGDEPNGVLAVSAWPLRL